MSESAVRRGSRLAILFAGAACAGAGVAASGARDLSIRTCTTSQLKIRLVSSGVAAGTVGGYIGFTNRANAPCRLVGWPTLVLLTRAGAASTAVRVRSTMFGPSLTGKGVPVVTLAHGGRADAAFTGADNPRPGETRCLLPYRYLRVTPPGNSRSVLISAWIPSYGHYLPACTRIEVSLLVPGSKLHGG